MFGGNKVLVADVCPTCGHRQKADRPQGQLTDTRSLVQSELAKDGLTQGQRIALMQMSTDLQVVATMDRRDKRHITVRKKTRIRKEQSPAEKALRKASRKRVIKPAVGRMDEDIVQRLREKYKEPEKPVIVDPEVTEGDNLQSFLSGFKKEENTNGPEGLSPDIDANTGTERGDGVD